MIETFKKRIIDLMGGPKLIEQKLFRMLQDDFPQLNKLSNIRIVNSNPVEIFKMPEPPVTKVITYQVPKSGLLNKFLRITDDLDSIPLEKNSGYETKTEPIEYQRLHTQRNIRLQVKSYFIAKMAVSLTCGYDPETDTFLLLEGEYYWSENPMGDLL